MGNRIFGKVDVSNEDLLMGDNFYYNGKTYRGDLAVADEDFCFTARLTNNGKEMVGEALVFQQNEGSRKKPMKV